MIEGRAKIVLTRRWPEAVEHRLSELGDLQRREDDSPCSRAELRQALQEADIVCPTVTDKLDAEVFAGLKIRTRLLANFGVGFNHIDLAAAAAANVQVTNTPGVLTDATAEIALTLLLMSARRGSTTARTTPTRTRRTKTEFSGRKSSANWD